MVFFSVESWLLLCTVILLVKYYLHRKWSVLKKLNVPHEPPSLLKLGNVLSIFSDKYFTYELEKKKEFGPIWGYYSITQPRIVVHDPEILRQICIKEFSSFPSRQKEVMSLNGKELSQGLLAVDGNQWKRTRATLAPTFSTLKLRQMAGIVNWCVDNTLNVFKKKIETQRGLFSAKDVFGRLSLDVVCSTAFSTNVNSQDEDKEEPAISKNAKKFFSSGLFRMSVFFAISFPFVAPLLSWISDHKAHIKYFKELCQKIMARQDKDGLHKRVDLMRLMIDAKVPDSVLQNGVRKGLSSVEIVGNAMTMLLAGYETTGTAMTYLAYNLATHPNVQKKLQEEIDEAFNGKADPNYDTINKLKYLDMCVNESSRMYCAVARTIRTAKSSTTISGLTIPTGGVVAIPIHALCHDPDFWDQPMEFKPERIKNMEEIDAMVFQPFGQGPRNCIGARFATMEIKLAFCKMLLEFTFEAVPDTPKPPLELVFDATTRPKVNFKLRVVSRH